MGINGGGGGSGGSGYYMVTAVDSGGTESVQSLAVKPASAINSAAGGAGGAMGCFIRAVGHPTVRPYLVIWLLVILAIGVAITTRRKEHGSRHTAQKQSA